MTGTRTYKVAVAIFVLVSAATVVYAATTTQTYTSGSTVQTDSGLSVTTARTIETASGNPFGSSESVTLKNVTFSAPGSGQITFAENSTQWTNVSQIGSSNTEITVNPPNKQLFRVEDGIQRVAFTDDVSTSTDDRTEVIVEATSSGNLTIDTGGSGAVAVDAETGEAIDEGDVNADGTVTFQIPSGTHKIDIQSAPSTLFVFQERNPSQKISGSAEIRVRFFEDGTDEVIERTVTDGEVDLSSIPADEQFVVTVKSSNNDFAYRRIVVDSLSEQQDVYLLNTTAVEAVDVDFRLTDYSGDYPSSETYLYIEKPITKDFDNDNEDETRYRTILGDNFGANGEFPAVLQQNERYRLRLDSGQNQRVLGAYTATRSEIEEITIQDIQIPIRSIETWTTLVNETGEGADRALTIRYIDKSNLTTALSVEVYPRGEPDNLTYSDTVTNNPIQNYTVYDIPIENDTSYTINWTITRDGETIAQRTLVGGGGMEIDIPLQQDWLGTFGFMTIAFFAALAGREKDHIISITVVAVAGMMMGLQVVRIEPLLWWLAALIAFGGFLAQRQRGGSL